MFQKGYDNNRNYSGRPKGSPNKDTELIRAAFHELISLNLVNLKEWIMQIGKENPEKAINIIIKLSDFVIGKRQAVNISHKPENGMESLSDKELINRINSILNK